MYFIDSNQRPDIRLTSFPGFFQLLGSFWPCKFAHHNAYELALTYMRLQQHFQCTPEQCIQIYVDMALHFAIPVCGFTYYKMAWTDVTVQEFHAQLWHETNQAYPDSDHPYPTQAKMLPHPI